MIDLLIICRDAFLNSYIGNLGLAILGKKAGIDVEVMFTRKSLNLECER